MSNPWQVISLEALALPDEGWRPDGWRQPGDALWPERWDVKKLEALRKSDAHVWQCNYQQRPIAAGSFWFKREDIHFYERVDPAGMNVYMLVDPALRKTKRADPTVVGVIGLGQDKNIYWLEVVRERIDPNERASLIFAMHRKWLPIRVGYEEYGLMSDVVTLKAKMERENYRFAIEELGRAGEWHVISKEDRIRTLQPIAQQGRLWLPDPEKFPDPKQVELVRYFIDKEWSLYAGPKTTQYDDVIDMLSRVNDPGMRATFPVKIEHDEPDLHWTGTSWMSA